MDELSDKNPQCQADGQGLSVVVRHNGTKLWLYRYRFGGKRKNMSFGTFPGVGLRAARDKCCATEKLLDRGQDPVAVREAKRNDDEKPARLRDVGVDRSRLRQHCGEGRRSRRRSDRADGYRAES